MHTRPLLFELEKAFDLNYCLPIRSIEHLFVLFTFMIQLVFICFFSYALYDKDGNQVPQDLVAEVGETFEAILKEARNDHLLFIA